MQRCQRLRRYGGISHVCACAPPARWRELLTIGPGQSKNFVAVGASRQQGFQRADCVFHEALLRLNFVANHDKFPGNFYHLQPLANFWFARLFCLKVTICNIFILGRPAACNNSNLNAFQTATSSKSAAQASSSHAGRVLLHQKTMKRKANKSVRAVMRAHAITSRASSLI